ncbi:hypothetical protein DsansV1_C12g0115751 [Dioscorea sansibarensis]
MKRAAPWEVSLAISSDDSSGSDSEDRKDVTPEGMLLVQAFGCPSTLYSPLCCKCYLSKA